MSSATAVAASSVPFLASIRKISRSVEETTGAAREFAARIATELAGGFDEMVGTIRSTVVRTLRSSVEQIDRRKSPPYAVTLEATYRAGTAQGATRVSNLSRGGAQVAERLAPNATGFLTIPKLGVPDIAVTVVYGAGRRSHLRFTGSDAELTRIGETVDRVVAPSARAA